MITENGLVINEIVCLTMVLNEDGIEIMEYYIQKVLTFLMTLKSSQNWGKYNLNNMKLI